MTLYDQKYKFYKDRALVNGTLTDLKNNFYAIEVQARAEDGERKWLRTNGGSGSTLHDLWMTYLAAKGYTTGVLRDRLMRFFSGVAGNVVDSGVDYANWSVAGAGSSKDATGITLAPDGANDLARYNTSLAVSSNYKLTYTVVSNTLTGGGVLTLLNQAGWALNTPPALNNSVGTWSFIVTTRDTITTNAIQFFISGGSGGSIKFANVSLVKMTP